MILKYAAMFIAMLMIAGGPAEARQDGATARRLSSEITPPNLPLHLMNGKATKNTLAILYSGDGGWQDIDERVGSYLQNEGIPVVGLDSLRYFWSERTPQETAKDLGRIIDYYTKKVNVQHVLLIGYSFGADVMPASYSRLSREQKSKVREISLLSLSHKVDYVISIRGWLGLQTEGKGGNPVDDVRSITPEIIQCIYGKDDDHDNACPALHGTGAQVIGMSGGHHFGGDYDRLAQHIIASLKTLPSK
uniref:Bacterial virulence family protein n=1 Tax=Rhizobium rhizogenes TaxID=359 RepID=A0A7S4ZTN1_RHIRH|nr:bacterial virulence family protein [Rhizobium rhizogenes]